MSANQQLLLIKSSVILSRREARSYRSTLYIRPLSLQAFSASLIFCMVELSIYEVVVFVLTSAKTPTKPLGSLILQIRVTLSVRLHTLKHILICVSYKDVLVCICLAANSCAISLNQRVAT